MLSGVQNTVIMRHSVFFPDSKFPPSLYAPVILEAHQNEIVSGFLMSFDTFILQLLSFKPFLDVVLNKSLGRFKEPGYLPNILLC